MKAGAELSLFNGQGLELKAQLEQVDKRQATVKLQQPIETNNESPLDILLMQGISRGERMDYAIQKAVELGVKRIMPVITERCNVQLSGDRAEKRLNHWQGVVISACEQSGRSFLPEYCRLHLWIRLWLRSTMIANWCWILKLFRDFPVFKKPAGLRY